MKLNTFLAVNAIVGLVLGAVLLVIPQMFLTLYDIQADAGGLAIARLFGAELIGFNIATWLARTGQDDSARRVVVLGHLFSESLGFIVALIAKLSGLGNTFFWIIVAVYLAFALGFAYFRFAKPKAA